jgi:hypothetical protein
VTHDSEPRQKGGQMNRPGPPREVIRKVIIAAAAITCGAVIGVGTHWMIGTEQPTRSLVKATILEPSEPDLMRPAIGQWTTPEGTKRAGVIPAPPDYTPGAEHPVWIDETGHIAHPPKSQIARITQASLAGTFAAAGLITFIRWSRPGVVTRLDLSDVGPGTGLDDPS